MKEGQTMADYADYVNGIEKSKATKHKVKGATGNYTVAVYSDGSTACTCLSHFWRDDCKHAVAIREEAV